MRLTRAGGQPVFLLEISGLITPTAVITFTASEKISHIYTVVVTLSTKNSIDKPEAKVGASTVLTISGSGGSQCCEDRHFNGILSKLVAAGNDGKFFKYEAEIVPSLWRLTLRKNSRIFQEMNVQDIVKVILEENGIKSDCYRFSLLNKARERGFCVQYRETDFDFVSRLLGEEGIFYFFQHTKEKLLLVISDDSAVHAPISGNKCIPFNRGGMLADSDHVSSFCFSQQMCPTSFTYRNFSFKKPSLDLTATRSAKDEGLLGVYEYPALYTTTERGEKLAQIRMEELLVQQQVGYGRSSSSNLAPGSTFTLTDHESDDFNGDYLILNVTHCGGQPQALEEVSEGECFYEASFSALPASVPYRPPIPASKPIIPGVQTAIVVGPPGQEIHTDEYGRIKVRFHWDRSAGKDGNSSCWLRINQPWSGSRWGMIAIPRVGDEVLVAFLEGDPDRPIMMGTVNNADSPALYQLPANQTQVGIRTQSTPNGTRDNFNELRFEDKKGSEHIYLQGEKDWNILIKNDKGQTIGHDEALKVKNNRTKTVGVNQSEVIGSNKSIEVGANHLENIGANMTVNVGAIKTETVTIDSMENVGLAKQLSVGGAYTVTVIGGMNTAVGLGQFEEVGLTKEVVVGKSLRVRAGDSIELICGKSRIKMDKAGNVTIKGKIFTFSASDHLQLTSDKIDLN